MTKYQNNEQDRRITTIEKQFIEACSKYNEEIGSVQVNIAKVKTDLSWLKKSYWVIAVATIGGLITQFFGLLGK